MTTPNDMLVLGIETSCDETAAAVVRHCVRTDARNPVASAAVTTGEILSNIVRSQWDEHRPFGGVVPELAARAHVECLDHVIKAAMADAAIDFSALDGIAVTAGPGLIGGLLVGVMTAKAIALVHGKALVGVNHLEAHALTVGLTAGLPPPYLLLLVSGGHTQLVIVHEVGRYERLGTTIDDALGEAFDKTAKLLGLGFPGGPAVEHAAKSGKIGRFKLPRPMAGRPEPHFSFAGLKTALRRHAEAAAPLSDTDVSDLCADFEAAVVASVADRVRRGMLLAEDALSKAAARTLVVAGGVAANQSLRSALVGVAAAQGYALEIPPHALCTDNGAMIAWAGAERLRRGWVSGLDFPARARWPLDALAVPALGFGRLGVKA